MHRLRASEAVRFTCYRARRGVVPDGHFILGTDTTDLRRAARAPARAFDAQAPRSSAREPFFAGLDG